jgi:hypothetical protein
MISKYVKELPCNTCIFEVTDERRLKRLTIIRRTKSLFPDEEDFKLVRMLDTTLLKSCSFASVNRIGTKASKQHSASTNHNNL